MIRTRMERESARALRAARLGAALVTAVPQIAQARQHSDTRSVERQRGAGGAVDAVGAGPGGGTRTVDRSRNPDGTTHKTVTVTPPPR